MVFLLGGGTWVLAEGWLWYISMDVDALWVWMHLSSLYECVSLDQCSLRELFSAVQRTVFLTLSWFVMLSVNVHEFERMTLCSPLVQRADRWVCSHLIELFLFILWLTKYLITKVNFQMVPPNLGFRPLALTKKENSSC